MLRREHPLTVHAQTATTITTLSMNHTETHYQQPSSTKELLLLVCRRYHVWCIFNTFIKNSTEDKDMGTTFLLFH